MTDEQTDIVGPVTVDMAPAKGMVVGPDDILVVVFPSWVDDTARQKHCDHLTEILGKRYMLMIGNDIQLAKVKAKDWADNAVD